MSMRRFNSDPPTAPGVIWILLWLSVGMGALANCHQTDELKAVEKRLNRIEAQMRPEGVRK
jgi:hypothetical protein